MITEQDKAIIEAQDRETLAKWSCALNRWEWPAELPNEETKEQYQSFMLSFGGPGVGRSRRAELMAYIARFTTAYLISREWNKDNMTPEEFEDFWRGNHEGDAEARARDLARTKEQAALAVAKYAARVEEWPELVEG